MFHLLCYQDFKEQIEEFCCKITKKARNIQIFVKNILLFHQKVVPLQHKFEGYTQ